MGDKRHKWYEERERKSIGRRSSRDCSGGTFGQVGQGQLHGGSLAGAALGGRFGGAGGITAVCHASQEGFTTHLVHQTVDLLLRDQTETKTGRDHREKADMVYFGTLVLVNPFG